MNSYINLENENEGDDGDEGQGQEDFFKDEVGGEDGDKKKMEKKKKNGIEMKIEMILTIQVFSLIFFIIF